MHKLSKWYMIEKLFNAFKNPTQLMKLKKMETLQTKLYNHFHECNSFEIIFSFHKV